MKTVQTLVIQSVAAMIKGYGSLVRNGVVQLLKFDANPNPMPIHFGK